MLVCKFMAKFVIISGICKDFFWKSWYALGRLFSECRRGSLFALRK